MSNYGEVRTRVNVLFSDDQYCKTIHLHLTSLQLKLLDKRSIASKDRENNIHK